MVKDGHVKELQRLLGLGRTLAASARMTEMSEKTASKYRDDERLPSERKATRDYRTRVDPFEEVWGEVQQRLEVEPKLKATNIVYIMAFYAAEFSMIGVSFNKDRRIGFVVLLTFFILIGCLVYLYLG